ncbi:hypothetical protein [Helicobacter sp. T3_23-1056]
MAKIDKLKEQLGMLKFWLGIFVATFLAIMGWSITNYAKSPLWILVGAGILSLLLICAICFISKKINAKIGEIGEA